MTTQAGTLCWDGFNLIGTDGEYTVYRTKMYNPLPVNTVSVPCLRLVCMDERLIANADGTFTFPQQLNDDGTVAYAGTTIPADTRWEVIVNAYAIQADGFDDIDDAIAAYAANGT